MAVAEKTFRIERLRGDENRCMVASCKRYPVWMIDMLGGTLRAQLCRAHLIVLIEEIREALLKDER